MTGLGEPPVDEHEGAGEHGESTGEECHPRAQLRPVVRSKPLQAPHRDEGAGEQRDRRDRACAESSGHMAKPLGSVRASSHSFTALVTWSSIVMRRFLVLASKIACDCAGVSVPVNCGTSLAGVLSACVHSTAWSVISGPYLWISL